MSAFFSTTGFMPHGHCFLWNPALVGLHVVADALIALAYISIPWTLTWFIRKRGDLSFNWIFLSFGIFIISCGATHAMEIWTLWRPDYWAAGLMKAITAVASVTTAIALFRFIPTVLAMPTARTLAEANANLRRADNLEAALRLSDSRYQSLADSGTIGIMMSDLDGTILEANEYVSTMLGYTREDVLAGRVRWTELTPPEWAEADRRAAEQLKSEARAQPFEKEYIRKDGTRVPVLLGAAMLEENRKQCLTFILDLTEKKRAEAAVERMRAQSAADAEFRTLLETAPDAIVVTNEEGRISFINERTEKLFGYARQELVGQHLELLVPERFRAAHARHLERFVAHPGTRAMGTGLEHFGRRRDGSEVPIEVSLSPLATERGFTVSAAIRDISERKRSEAAAKLLSDRLASAVESVQEPFALFDREDRLVLCNSVYRELLSSVSGPLTGKPYEELLRGWAHRIEFEGDSEREQFVRQRVEQRCRDKAATFDVKLHDGRRLRVADRPTSEGGCVKTIWDLTEDVRLADELREARQAAEDASNAKSEFVSSMSHELRTPLNAILGFAQLLQRDRKEPLSERHKERVSQILRGGEHLLNLINDILDLSRIESGKLEVSVEPIQVSQMLEEVQSSLEPIATRNGIQLQIEPPPADLPLVAADRTRCVQILMNFGSNAIKYNRQGGSAVFSVMQPRPGYLRIAVRDTGLGVPLEKQDKLFQPFQRAGQETGPIEGTGIGLFITKRLSTMMRGDVGFSSTPEVGSEFWVDLPVAEEISRPAMTQRPHETETPRNMSARRILYVEDNPANVEFMRDVVSAFDDVDLITASTAELGLELARAHCPHVIVMDINLPGMSGLDALRALRGLSDTQDIPVIALSAAATERDKQRGTQAGFHRYLTKPVKVDELMRVLEELFGSLENERTSAP
jgi:PAS domain S-box-containing protein